MTERATQKQKATPRPPVVVVLGHVDHGKTSILDKIRQTRVAEKEAGGITQHIGAYQAEHQGKIITFLDTPGHEAFSAIRARGAKVADVAILVVAADEGVKPQTKEAVQIINTAKIPFVVAINKIDKEGANPQRVRQELAEAEVLVEDYGGNVPIVELSAKNGKGLDHLLEIILLLAEMEELSAPSTLAANGIIIESHLDSRRGLVATLIVQAGEIKINDWVSAGVAYGRVKSLQDFTGKTISSAVTSQPCLMLGWESAPKVGEEFKVVSDKNEAEKLSALAAELGPKELFLETEPTDGQKKIANFIIKTDVQSSLEAIDQALRTIKSEEVSYKIVGYGVGNINDADIKNARATSSSVIGFHVNIDDATRNSAEREKIVVTTYQIIYDLIEGVRTAMSDLLPPEIRRIALGRVKILGIFSSQGSSAKTQIIGGKITQGKISRGALIDVFRNNVLIATGRLSQLQQNKADVSEASEGYEVGIRFELTANDKKLESVIKIGDVLEVYEEEKIKRSV